MRFLSGWFVLVMVASALAGGGSAVAAPAWRETSMTLGAVEGRQVEPGTSTSSLICQLTQCTLEIVAIEVIVDQRLGGYSAPLEECTGDVPDWIFQGQQVAIYDTFWNPLGQAYLTGGLGTDGGDCRFAAFVYGVPDVLSGYIITIGGENMIEGGVPLEVMQAEGWFVGFDLRAYGDNRDL